MPKHVLLLAIVAGFFIADSADAQFFRRLLGLEAPAPAFDQPPIGQPQFGERQFGQPQFGQRPPVQPQFRQTAPQYNGAQPMNGMQGYQQQFYQQQGYQQLTPQQVINGQRPMPIRPPMMNGQERFRVGQQGPVRRFVDQYGRQYLGMRETLTTIQTPNGPRVVRVQIPTMNLQPQGNIRSAQMPQMQTPQPPAQPAADKLASQPSIQQPLSVGPTQVSPASSSIPGVVQPLETGPALTGPALNGPAVISNNTNDASQVVPASAVIEETRDVAPISLDEAAPNQIPELDAPALEGPESNTNSVTETKTQGAPSILKRK